MNENPKIDRWRNDGEWHAAEEYDEWHLVGQPTGNYPLYDVSAQGPERAEALKSIYRKIQSGDYLWKDAVLTKRHVLVLSTQWVSVDLTEDGIEERS